jgi:hypothetical protein
MDVVPAKPQQSERDQRAFSETPGREQKDFLAVREVSNQLVEFRLPVDEVGLLDDLAEDERIFGARHYAI